MCLKKQFSFNVTFILATATRTQLATFKEKSIQIHTVYKRISGFSIQNSCLCVPVQGFKSILGVYLQIERSLIAHWNFQLLKRETAERWPIRDLNLRVTYRWRPFRNIEVPTVVNMSKINKICTASTFHTKSLPTLCGRHVLVNSRKRKEATPCLWEQWSDVNTMGVHETVYIVFLNSQHTPGGN